jgi:integrase
MATTDPIREVRDVKAMLAYFHAQGEIRNYCLFAFGIYSALRVGDMLALLWDDVYEFKTGRLRVHLSLREQKTKKFKTVLLNDSLVNILAEYKNYLEQEGDCVTPGSFLFKSQKGENAPITRQHANSIIKTASKEVGISGVIGCHSLRKTFGYAAQKSGAPPTVIMDIYNHSSYQITKRYLGIDQDEKDTIYRMVTYK